MNKMPRRPREHVLETESELAFRKLIPATWVVREVLSDYGVDKEVEIFEDGQATGITFKVQLKGTDADFGDKSPFVRVKSSTLSYWLKLDSPVLIVLYCAKNDRVHARWAHSYDPHPRKFPKVSSTFKFSPKDRLSSKSHIRIESELAYVRAFRARSINGRVPVRLVSRSITGVDTERLNFHLISIIRNCDGVLSTDSNEDGTSIEVEVLKNEIAVTFPADIASMTIHDIRNQYSGEEAPRILAADILLVISAIFARLGLASQTIEVLRYVPTSSPLLKESELGCKLAEALIFADRLPDALPLIEVTSESPVDEIRDYATRLLGLIAMHRSVVDLNMDQHARILFLLERLAVIEEQLGNLRKAGRTWYIIAQKHRAARDYERARDSFTRALETDRTYELRGYIFRERGAAFYELDELSSAEADYRRAIDVGGVPEAQFLLALVLIEMGKYEEASNLSHMLSSDLPEYYAIGAKVFPLVAETLYLTVQISTQMRKPVPDELLNRIEVSDVSSAEIIDAMQSWDAFDPRLWVKLSNVEDDLNLSFKYLLVAAWICQSNAQLWIYAICAAFVNEEGDITPLDVWKKARLFCPNIVSVAEQLMPGMPETLRQEVQTLVFSRSLDPLPHPPRVVRIIGDEDEYLELDAEIAYEILRPGGMSTG
ncbi:DUF4365 domain-containing protein [Glycomyces algeriensis]|uniref:DUF4365 domain-containing protein n=1 Tax=Glycomyces algeriensis TaxID=256037 RepID=A0A9W6LIT6_9ACTN|nr:DUF4365 domain-containing protein [Glycomyces algeriensis]MDA1367866.1 DUF4365 domain-containing protein [Glycomyces algeriensis]MDR7352013.1 tetratricopeptide (TPR) repeat protein [Glycomyces algeriensis]GLI44745.1 hypothetical protein GALLR39Z86_45950 [Glycomyces algeriensis]